MDVNKWKSIAVDIESYTIIRAMGANGLRNPGNMIKKMVSDSKLSDKNLDDLVLQMNSPLYKTRPSFKECLAHKFFN